MTSHRKWNIFLPNDRKLEFKVQPKHTGKDLVDIVASHLNLKEKDYFGITYDVDGCCGWIQDEKNCLSHDIAKKSRVDLKFAVKYFVESVTLLKNPITTELYFLHVRSLIYKGCLDTDDVTNIFKLAAYVIQITCGDFESEEKAILQLKSLPVLPRKVIRQFRTEECEKEILSIYKELKGYSKGKAIIDYLKIVESIPTYGLHYFKVKDKGGVPWYLGISYRGISQFDIHNKTKPVKSFLWRQLENIVYKEKKFSIEVNEGQQQQQRGKQTSGEREAARNKDHQHQQQVAPNVTLHAWYGSVHLIKNLFYMSISQHRFFLDRKLSKGRLHKDSSRLEREITENPTSLIELPKQLKSNATPTMSRRTIKDVQVTERKGCVDESPQLRACERDVLNAMKLRRTELEDRLYDRVQELKKISLQEAEFTGKLPKEYIRYLDLNEKVPKVKKKIVGAEYKLKLTSKQASGDYQTSVTAASSYSSGFGSDVIDSGSVLSSELSRLEVEASILEQICKATHTLAKDEAAHKKIRDKRKTLYKSNLDKLKKVEDRVNELRAQIGHQPAERASVLFPEDFDYASYEDSDAEVKQLKKGAVSTSGSISPAASNEDGYSVSSSGGDALSTHSTPATLTNQSASNMMAKQHPASTALERRSTPSLQQVTTKRSLTPPAVLRGGGGGGAVRFVPPPLKFIPPALASSTKLNTRSPVKASHQLLTTTDNSTLLPPPKRNWTSRKWEKPRTERVWTESTLDSSHQHASDNQSVTSDTPNTHPQPQQQTDDDASSTLSYKTTSREPTEEGKHHQRKRSCSFDESSSATLTRRPHHLDLGPPTSHHRHFHPPSPHTEVYNVPLASPKLPPAYKPPEQPYYKPLTYQQVYPHHTAATPHAFADLRDVPKHEDDDSDLESNVDWAPSLHEYSCRASVAEAYTAQKKKEDILRTIEEHIKRTSISQARPPTSSTSSSSNLQQQHKQTELQKKMLANFRASNTDPHQPMRQQHPPAAEESTWANYKQKQMGSREHLLTNQGQHKSRYPTSVFQHKKPPLPQQQVTSTSPPPSPMLYRTQRKLATNNKSAPYYPINLVAQSWSQTARRNNNNHHHQHQAYDAWSHNNASQQQSYGSNHHQQQQQAGLTNNSSSGQQQQLFYYVKPVVVQPSSDHHHHLHHRPNSPLSTPADDNISTLSARSNPQIDRVMGSTTTSYMTSSPYMQRRDNTQQQQLHYPVYNHPPQQPNLVLTRPYHRRQAASAEDLLSRREQDSTNMGTLV